MCSSVLEYDACSRVSGSRYFEGKFRLHLENFRVHEECTFMELETLKTFLRNVGTHLPGEAAPHPRTPEVPVF